MRYHIDRRLHKLFTPADSLLVLRIVFWVLPLFRRLPIHPAILLMRRMEIVFTDQLIALMDLLDAAFAVLFNCLDLSFAFRRVKAHRVEENLSFFSLLAISSSELLPLITEVVVLSNRVKILSSFDLRLVPEEESVEVV